MNARFRPITTLGFAVAIAIALFAYLSLPENEPTQSDPDRLGDSDDDIVVAPALSPEKTSINLSDTFLRSALTGLCDSSDQRPSNDTLSPEEKQARIDRQNELPQKVADRLSVSSSADHLQLAALLEKNATTRIELLDRAISLNPNDAFLLWQAVHICVEERDATSCRQRKWEQRLLLVDGQNSETWIRVAANRYVAGENKAALDAIRHAATAAVSQSYWTETIEMTERGFAAATEFAFPERVGIAFGVAAANLPRSGHYVTMCKEQSVRNVEWAYTCLAYGQLVENQGKTEMDVGIARAIQRLALEALGDDEGAAELRQREEAIQQERLAQLDSTGNNYMIAARLMTSSPTLLSTYLAAVKTNGEAAAMAYFVNATSRLLLEHPELACDP